MMKNSRFALFSGAALAALALVPAPLRAQEGELSRAQVQSNLRLLRILEDGLSRAEKSRLKGDCTSVRITAEVFLDRLHGRQIIYRNRSDPLPDLPPDAKADLERRINEILARDCPPRSGTSSLSTANEGANQTGFVPPSAPLPPETAPAAAQPLPPAPSPVGSHSRADPPAGPPVILTDEQRNLGTDWSPELRDYFIKFLLGGGQADVPQTGTGFMRDGPSGSAPEEFAKTTPERVDFVSVEGFFQFFAGRTPMRIGVSYAEGDASNLFDILGNSGIDSGVVYGDDAPSGSSSPPPSG